MLLAEAAKRPVVKKDLNTKLRDAFIRRVVERTRYERHCLREIELEWRRARLAIVTQIRQAGLFTGKRAEYGIATRQSEFATLLAQLAGIVGFMVKSGTQCLQTTVPDLIELEAKEIPVLVNRLISQAVQEAEELSLLEYIVKVKDGYRIISHRTGKNLGTFATRAQAKRRLRQLARFREALGLDTDEKVVTYLAEAPDDLFPAQAPHVGATFSSVPVGAINQLVQTPLGGDNFATSFADLGTTVMTRLRNSLLTGLVRGFGIDTVAKDAQKLLGNTRWQAERIVRSEFGRVTSRAALAQFSANRDLLNGVMWVATLDNRTCLQCGDMDGETWANPANAELPVESTHPNCRCVLVPVVKSAGALNLSAGLRASMTGEVPATIKYADWFADQSPLMQREILGATRYKLWNTGKLALSDFVSSRGVRSVKTVLKKPIKVVRTDRDRDLTFHSVSGSEYSGRFGGTWETTPLVRGQLPGIRMQTFPESRSFLAQLQAMPKTHLELIRSNGGVLVRMDARLPKTTNGEFGAKSGIRISTLAKNPDGTLIHEFGHAIDEAAAQIGGMTPGGRWPRLSQAYIDAVGTERVSRYASTGGASEAFAEAYAMYASLAGRVYMGQTAPKSKAFMERIFNSDLSKQDVVRSFFPPNRWSPDWIPPAK